MGLRALTETDDGKTNVPESDEEWNQWVSASKTRNFIIGDPLIDWLHIYGADRGYKRDDELPGYDERTDFTTFIFQQGNRFETAVVDHLRSKSEVVVIATEREHIRELSAAEKTYQAMAEGVPIIHQGVLRDPEHGTYGAPDLLIRSDVLAELFSDCVTEQQATVNAPDLGSGNWHYRVVDVKFTTCHLLVDGTLNNSTSKPAYKTQLFIYNRALGRIQGYEPDASFILSRGWEQTVKGVTTRGTNCIERLTPLPRSGTLSKKQPIADMADAACNWLRDVRNNGGDWQVTPQPTRPELYPDFSNTQDGPWHGAKSQIAKELEDLTLLWQVGVTGRSKAHESGVFRWTDPVCTPAIVGVTGDKNPRKLQAMLDINRNAVTEKVLPTHISANEEIWRPEPALEFYVDFETVSDLADDFSTFPERGGQPLIFMIGCGHVENGEWKFRCFVADRIDEKCEETIIDEWLAYMDTTRDRLSPDEVPNVFHWSPAEKSTYETSYISAKERHPEKNWPSPNWFDFLNRVVKEEPVVIRGAMGFGLKAVATALYKHGLIETCWKDGSVDGLGAMVGAWWCHEEAFQLGVPMIETEMMKEIVDYNEVDCKVMMEAVRYFRCSH